MVYREYYKTTFYWPTPCDGNVYIGQLHQRIVAKRIYAGCVSACKFIRIAGKPKERNLMLARLEFINSIAQLSEPYLIRLQTESILIHTLYDELVQLLRLQMNRFVKGNILENKNDCDLSEIVLEPHPADQCDFGTHTQKLVRALKNEKTES